MTRTTEKVLWLTRPWEPKLRYPENALGATCVLPDWFVESLPEFSRMVADLDYQDAEDYKDDLEAIAKAYSRAPGEVPEDAPIEWFFDVARLENRLRAWKAKVEILRAEVRRLDLIVRRTNRVVPNTVRLAVCERDGYRCRYCGIGLLGADVQMDHWNPDGVESESNLVVACRGCNAKKRNYWPASELKRRTGMTLLGRHPRTPPNWEVFDRAALRKSAR